ncbi:hypothetical protein C1H46_013623 [Malus baccata]|uniref:Uncharacterized protein n=1 Tax=Malus baccata TaxID=106549 RepID=A0A540MPV8_MALBA|nr:hypothetical protein C1H46_013623 [Malus baccata]
MPTGSHNTRLIALNVPPMGLFFPMVLVPDAYPPPPSVWVLHAIPSNEAIDTVEILGILDIGWDAWVYRDDWIRNGIHIGSGTGNVLH